MSTITLQCPRCGQETEKPLAWFKRYLAFDCACGERVGMTRDDFDEFIAECDEARADEVRRLGIKF